MQGSLHTRLQRTAGAAAPAALASCSSSGSGSRAPALGGCVHRPLPCHLRPIAAAGDSNGGVPDKQLPQQQPQGILSTPSSMPSSLNLPYETAQQQLQAQAQAAQQQPKRTVKSLGGLRRAPLSGGVKTATERYDLPAPSVAVRNLVEQAQFAHLCTIMSHMHHR